MSDTSDNRRHRQATADDTPPGDVQPEDTAAGDTASAAEASEDAVRDDISEPELDEILDRLRMIAGEFDAPPSIVAELARATFETRNLDAKLAVLTADSDFDVLELVRSVAVEPRMVSFETDSVTVELQLDRHDSELTVRGLVVGAVGEITVDTGDQRTPAQLDDRGWFLVEGVPTGALRLRVHGADGINITTEWITT
jgi:hypothetical protein